MDKHLFFFAQYVVCLTFMPCFVTSNCLATDNLPIPQPQGLQQRNQICKSSRSLFRSQWNRLRTSPLHSDWWLDLHVHGPVSAITSNRGLLYRGCMYTLKLKALMLSIVLKYLRFLMMNIDCTKFFFFFFLLVVHVCFQDRTWMVHHCHWTVHTGVKSQSSVVNCCLSRCTIKRL